MASNTLQDWQNYINDYENKLSDEKQRLDAILADPNKTEVEKKKALDDYYRNQTFLQELKDKYNEYSLEGEVPDEVTFGGGDPTPVLIYKSNISGDTIHHGSISTSWGGSGDLSHAGDEVPIGSIFTSDLLLISAKVVKTDYSSPQQTDVSFSGPRLVQLQSGYDWYCDSNKNLDYWTKTQFNPSGISITMYEDPWSNGNARPLIRAYWGSVTNPVSINQGGGFSTPITFTLLSMLTNPEGTVDGDSPWDYYDKIPVDPDNDLYPNGYEPPGPGDDPEDGPVEEEPPDKTDWGAPELPYTGGFDTSNSFCNYAAFTKIGINALRVKLWDQPDDFWDALSMAQSNAANWLDYFINIRAYPYRITTDNTLNRYLYVGRGGEIDMGGDGSEQFQYKVPNLVRIISWSWQEDTISKHYNNFLDFAPYTKAEIYLPFSGTWEINPTWLYHTELILSLAIDITDGSGTWQLMAYRDGESAIVLRKQCKVGVELPISGNDAMSQSSAIVNATLTTAQHAVNNVKTIASGIASAATSKGKAAVAKEVGSLLEEAPNMVIQGLSDSANMAFASKEKPSYSGGSTGAAAARMNIVPSIKVHRPIAKNPETFGHTVGNLVNKASKLEKLNGFTVCRNVDISNVPQATDKEKAELKRILEGGFYAVSG